MPRSRRACRPNRRRRRPRHASRPRLGRYRMRNRPRRGSQRLAIARHRPANRLFATHAVTLERPDEHLGEPTLVLELTLLLLNAHLLPCPLLHRTPPRESL